MLLLVLGSNPDVTNIPTLALLSEYSDAFSDDWRRLAYALQGNSHVSELTLDLTYTYRNSIFMTKEGIRMSEPFLQYLRKAPPTLQTLHLTTNDYRHGALETRRSL